MGKVADYIKFRFSSGNQHGLHSPFVFKLYTEVIRKDYRTDEFIPIEEKRIQFTQDRSQIKVSDFGAGGNKDSKRIVGKIAKSSLKSPKESRLIYRLVKYFQPKHVLELGTSLGITTTYISKAAPHSQITTLEGSESICLLAQQGFAQNNVSNLNIISGNIDNTLPEFLNTANELDFVFFDANHRLQPTLSYFEQCLTKSTEDSVFVFDDIYWSEEMKQAWKEIKNHPQVNISIDLFHLGLIFFRKKQPKQHFKLRF